MIEDLVKMVAADATNLSSWLMLADYMEESGQPEQAERLRIHQSNQCFLTGSRAYGIPVENSDIDLVIFVDEWELSIIARLGHTFFDGNLEQNIKEGMVSIRFGILNIIACSSRDWRECWWRGTVELVTRCKAGEIITRDVAIECFDKWRSHYKLPERKSVKRNAPYNSDYDCS